MKLKSSSPTKRFELLWRAMNGQELIKEHRFHPTRKWRVDFWHSSGVAIEIEGGVWTGGRHTRGKGFIADMEKYNALAERGILVFRIPGHQINLQWLAPIYDTIQRGGSMSYLKLLKRIEDASI
jgi:very-short-patch-repair endonuclease